MNKARRRRCKILSGPSILRVFGSSYKYAEEAKAERRQRRKSQKHVKPSKLQISTQRSIYAISTAMGNKR